MAKREVIGVCNCTECGFEDAEIKAQKSGLLYRWCPECNAQYFTRDTVTSERLRAKIRGAVPKVAPVTVPDSAPEPVKPAPKPAQKVEAVPVPVVIPKKSGLDEALQFLGGKL